MDALGSELSLSQGYRGLAFDMDTSALYVVEMFRTLNVVRATQIGNSSCQVHWSGS